MSLRFHEAALAELRAATRFYANCASVDVALAFVSDFERSGRSMLQFPMQGGQWFRARRWMLRRFPYSIIYRLTAFEVIIIAVAHHRREPHYWITRS